MGDISQLVPDDSMPSGLGKVGVDDINVSASSPIRSLIKRRWRGIAEIAAVIIVSTTILAWPSPPTHTAHSHPVSLTADSPGCWSPSTAVSDAFATQKDKAWTCTEPYGAHGGIQVPFHLDGVHKITEMCLTPGWDYRGPDGDQWKKYRTMRAVNWRFYLHDILLNREPVEQQFDEKKRTQQCKPVGGDMVADTAVMFVERTCPCKASGSGGLFPKLDLPGMPTGGPAAGNMFGAPAAPAQSEPTAFAVQRLEIRGVSV